MASVTFENATRRFGKKGKQNTAVDNLNLTIADGEFLVLVGPSGCGKSTSLRMLAGLEPVDEGRILIGGEDASRIAPRDRDVAMVFQNYALYPNMTVAGNMAFALKNRGMKKAEISERVSEASRILELDDLLDRKPSQLSGGQRQRVAMGRAIVRDPAVFCMDEPLSNLDAKLRVSTRAQISSLQRRLGTTTVYVTHDQVEAMTMGDRVAVLNDGRLQQVASPHEVYNAPANLFVATFIGAPSMSLFGCEVRDGRATIDGVALPVNCDESRVTIGVRPEHWGIVGEEPESVSLGVDHVEELGSESFVYCKREGADASTFEGPVAIRVPSDLAVHAGTRIFARPTKYHVFDPETGKRLESC